MPAALSSARLIHSENRTCSSRLARSYASRRQDSTRVFGMKASFPPSCLGRLPLTMVSLAYELCAYKSIRLLTRQRSYVQSNHEPRYQ